MMFNKKAQFANYAVWWLTFKAGFTIAVTLVAILIVAQGYTLSTPDRSSDADVIAHSLYFSPVLMITDDLTGKIFYGNIDKDAFSSQNKEKTSQLLQEWIKVPEGIDYFAMQIILVPRINSENTKIIYYNRELYNEFSTYLEGGFTGGEGGYTLFKRVIPVTIGKEKEPGILLAEIIIPNG